MLGVLGVVVSESVTVAAAAAAVAVVLAAPGWGGGGTWASVVGRCCELGD